MVWCFYHTHHDRYLNCVSWIYGAAACVKYYSLLPVKWQKSPYAHKTSRFILTFPCCSSGASYYFSLLCFLPADRKSLDGQWKSFLKFFLFPLSPTERKCCYQVASLLINCRTGNNHMDIHMIGTLNSREDFWDSRLAYEYQIRIL